MTRHLLRSMAHKVCIPPHHNQLRQLSAFQVSKISAEMLDKLISHCTKQDSTQELHCVDLNDRYHKLAVIVRKQQTKQKLVQYLHATCMLSVKSTYIRAIKRINFLTWSGLIEDLSKRHHPPSILTAQKHLHRERTKLKMTKQQPTIKTENRDVFLDHFPAFPDLNTKTNEVAYVVIDRSTLSLVY